MLFNVDNSRRIEQVGSISNLIALAASITIGAQVQEASFADKVEAKGSDCKNQCILLLLSIGHS